MTIFDQCDEHTWIFEKIKILRQHFIYKWWWIFLFLSIANFKYFDC